MPPHIARLIGGAGTGKTTELIRLMEAVVDKGVDDPRSIGFVSFTRAAADEAARRAASRFDVKVEELQQAGWFRTIHSVCYKALGVGKELLAGNAADRRWLEEAVDEPSTPARTQDQEELSLEEGAFVESSNSGVALALWDAARNRLEPYNVAHGRASSIDERLPDLAYCAGVVARYEQAKRLDGRIDFTDILGLFAGHKFALEGKHPIAPDGYVPALPVWFFDEQQDTSALLDAVCRRLIGTPQVQWVYVTGDPFQAIYSWAGADARYFLGWDADKQRVMPKSYRCPSPILSLGESILRGCSDYWDRGIAPADHEGSVEHRLYRDGVADEVDPREEWLLIARSNWHARRIAATLDKRNIPWVPTKGKGRWTAPVRHEALTILLRIQQGEPIDGAEWGRAISRIPSVLDGQPLLAHGTKAKFTRDDWQPAEAHPWVMPDQLGELGATPHLVEMIRSGKWAGISDEAERFAEAVQRWGVDVVTNPRCRVGTIHSCKGMEADNVVLLTSTSHIVERGMEEQAGLDEELRVWYVGATRARRRLIVATERTRFNMELPE